jgi:hypothetical protein
LSESFFITFETAISKSSWVTCTLRSRSAYMPASVQTAYQKIKIPQFNCTFISAPEAPCNWSEIFFKLIPLFQMWVRFGLEIAWWDSSFENEFWGYQDGPFRLGLETQFFDQSALILVGILKHKPYQAEAAQGPKCQFYWLP